MTHEQLTDRIFQLLDGLNNNQIYEIVDLVDEYIKEHALEWIPCSERLPEEGQEILATTAPNGWYDVVIIRTYYAMIHKSVIAWMPLPEPWKGE